MANTFPVSGNIEPETFPHLLVDFHRQGATGSLKVTGPSHPKALYFRSGRILFGSSNDPRDQLGSILIESGKISREQLDEVNVKVGPGNPLAKVLSESGFVNQRELGDAARVKVERILADVLAWDSGSFEFEDGVLPKGAVDLKLSTEKLLLSAVQRIPDRSFALRHVELRTVLEPAPEGDGTLTEIRADVWPLLERFDGQRTLKDAIALTRLDEFEAAKTACALLFLGVVRKKATTNGEELDLAQEAQSGLGADDESAPLTFSVPPQPVAAKPRPFAFAAEDTVREADAPAEEDRPFAFPEPSPALAPEGAPAYRALAEPEPDQQPFVFPEAAPTLAFTPSAAAPDGEDDGTPAVVEDDPLGGSRQPEPEDERGAPEPTVVMPSLAASDVSGFSISAPAPARRVPSDTLPGDRPELPALPSLSPPLSSPPSSPSSFVGERIPSSRPDSTTPPAPAIPVSPAPTSRPTSTDLAALDELLSTSVRRDRPAEKSRSERWEPQFRPRTTPPRRAPLRPAGGSPSRMPLVATTLVGVALVAAAGWYFLIRVPGTVRLRPPVARTSHPVSTLAAPPSSLEAPATVPSSPPAASATPAPLVEPTAAAVDRATPPPHPVAAEPRTTPPPPAPRASAGPPRAAPAVADGRALLRQGALADAARAFAGSLAGSRSAYSLQVLTACAPETVQKAASAAGGSELFILPVVLNGKSCFRVCWGVYESRQAAESALATIPAYFRQGGARPRLSPLAELLP